MNGLLTDPYQIYKLMEHVLGNSVAWMGTIATNQSESYAESYFKQRARIRIKLFCTQRL